MVSVRNRRWSVLDVRPSALPAPQDAAPAWAPQNVVRLSSLEDDAFGEELEVVWEIEPGASIDDATASLPDPRDGFDDPTTFEAYLHAVQWGAISQFDLDAPSGDAGRLQAPFRSGIHVQDYQLDPLVRALQMPRVNLLIADDVGLGKTIESGLVAQELVLRHRARRILVICPAGLQVQWREQMRDKFGLDFKIVDSDLLRRLRRERGIHVNPWGHHPRLIVSMDYVKRARPMHLLRRATERADGRVLPRWGDVLILDEAHNVAPKGTARYAKESERTRAIREIVDHFEHKLFLTATPHDGNQHSFTALLEMLDDQRFARGVMPEHDQLHQVMVRRMKSDLKKNWDGSSRFPEREIRPLEVEYSDTERELHRLLQEYGAARQARTGSEGASIATGFVLKTLKKRLFSSPRAFAITLNKHRQRLAGVTPDDDSPVRPQGLKRFLERLDDEAPADDEAMELHLGEGVEVASGHMEELSATEEELLARLRARADAAANRPDAKVRALVDWLDTHIRPDGEWSNERVIIFTEYRATQTYVFEHLANLGFAKNGRLELMFGGMDLDERERIKQAFQADPSEPGAEVRILLATDTASEGIDLQNHCSKLIHIEVPWNPNVMEQRNGRVDRYGQTRDVEIFHFVPAGFDHDAPDPDADPGELEGDLEFLFRAVRKVDQIREDLGKVGPVIAEQVEQALVGGSRTRLDTRHAEDDDRLDQQILRRDREWDRYISDLRQRLTATRRELDLSPDAVAAVVHTGLSLANQPPLEPAELDGLETGAAWRVPHLRGTWQRLTEGLEDPHSRRIRPIVFDQALVERRSDVVLAHLNHPLVQRCLRLLRANAWSATSSDLHRATVQVVDDTVLDTAAVVAFARLVVLGGDAQRIHEEIVSAGGTIAEGRFRRFTTRSELNAVVEAIANGPVDDGVTGRLADLWDRLEDGVTKALQAREAERTETLANRLATRRDREIADVTDVMSELARRIEQELADPVGQLELFGDDLLERQRDVASLEARLAEIPAEIERETGRITARYSDAAPRSFPFAVVFVVPRSIAGGAR